MTASSVLTSNIIIASSYEQALCRSPQCRLLDSYSCKKLRRRRRGTKNKAIPAKTKKASAWALKTWQAWASQCLPSDGSNEGPEMQHLISNDLDKMNNQELNFCNNLGY